VVQTEGEVEVLRVIVATSVFDGQGITPEPLNWVLLRVVLGDSETFEFLGKVQITKPCEVGGEVVAVADFGSLLGAADLVDPVADVVATVCIVGGVAIHMASASAITAATNPSATAAASATAAVAAM
jgi:hypothetical protein